MSKRKPYKRYSPEFKREALKRACGEGVTDRLICKELDISERHLRRWRDEYRLLAMKVVYLAVQAASKKWTMPIRNWKLAMNRFMIEFEDRLADYI